jgi:hypothetical protein
MGIEDISKEECLIKEALNRWTHDISDKYIERHELAMDAKMYMSLNKLYLKRKQLSSMG